MLVLALITAAEATTVVEELQVLPELGSDHLPVSLKQTVTHVDAERGFQEAITNKLRQKQPSEDPMEAWDYVKSTIWETSQG